MPKADETTRLGYRTPGGNALEVDGVCRFDESSVSRWDAEGKPHEELTKRVTQGLTQRPGEGNLAIRFGMKNRILVTRQTQMMVMNGQGERKFLSLMSVGDDPRYGSGSYVSLPEEQTHWAPDKPQIRREARVFAVEPSKKQTQMRLMLSEPLPDRPELRLVKGVKASLGGCTFTVTSIGLADASRMGWPGSPGMKMWSVKVRQTGKPTRPSTFYPGLGEMVYLDKSGKVVGQKDYNDWMQKRSQASMTSGRPIDFNDNPFRPVNVQMMGSRDGEMEVIMNVDPKVLQKVSVSGNYQKTIDVTGIPLDPR